MQIVFDAAKKIRGFRAQDDFTFAQIDAPITTGGSTVDQSDYDAVLSATTSIGADNNFRIAVAPSLSFPGHTFVNQTPTIASVDTAGNVSRIASGTANIDIKAVVGTRSTSRVMTNSSITTYVHKNYKAGSVGLHVVNAINALIASKSPSSTTQKFTTTNNLSYASPSVARNASLFTGALDLSAISVIRSDQTVEAYPLLLISPRHFVCAGHIAPAVGTGIVFKAPNGTYQKALVVSGANYDGFTSDIVVGYLDTAISGIAPFKFLPANHANYIASQTNSTQAYRELPCLVKAYNMGGSYFGGLTVVGSTVLSSSAAWMRSGQDMVLSTYKSWSNAIAGGDSGSPIMLPINGELVLVSAFKNAPGGAHWERLSAWMESQMASQAVAQGDNAPYALLRADLSSFTQFTTQ